MRVGINKAFGTGDFWSFDSSLKCFAIFSYRFFLWINDGLFSMQCVLSTMMAHLRTVLNLRIDYWVTEIILKC